MSALTESLPKPVRRRLGRYKRAVQRRIAPGSVPPPKKKPAKKAAAKKAAPAAKRPAPNPTLPERLELRRACVFETAARDGRMLEIGAAHNGTLPKRDGYATKIVDYLDRDGLVEKYSTYPQYSPDDIEEVDFVLADGAGLTDVIHEKFDLVLASHVIEHTTSLVHFLNEAAELLDDGGTLALVVPDHRYCFDRFRERSSIGRVIDTFHNPPKFHTIGTLTEFKLNAVKHRGSTSWVENHRGEYSFVHTLDDARDAERAATTGVYVDVHNWIFSPHHLRLMIHDLHALGLTSLREAYFHDTVGHEFFMNLTADGPGSGLTREQLVSLADAELTVDSAVFEKPADEAVAPGA